MAKHEGIEAVLYAIGEKLAAYEDEIYFKNLQIAELKGVIEKAEEELKLLRKYERGNDDE